MENSTKQLFTTVAENLPRVKEQGRVEGYEAGKKAEYDTFWDALQGYGNRASYDGVFTNYNTYTISIKHGAWNETNFKPKYPIAPKTSGTPPFSGLEIENFKEHCEKNGIIIDLSQITSLSNFYRQLLTEYLPDMNVPNATSINSCFYGDNPLKESPNILNGGLIENYGSCYYNCSSMTRIPRLWATSVTTYSSAFWNDKALIDIDIIEGEIKVSIGFNHSPLSVASLKNIVKHLKDYANTEYTHTYTLTVKASAWEGLESAGYDDEDYEWIESKYGVPKDVFVGVSWGDVVLGLGWNLVLA